MARLKWRQRDGRTSFSAAADLSCNNDFDLHRYSIKVALQLSARGGGKTERNTPPTLQLPVIWGLY